jgi:anthranilate synthase component 2/para-aminobenzoate synthetase component 2
MSARLLLIDNYDSFTYNLVQAFLVLEAEVLVYRNDALTVGEAMRLAPTHLVISPGPGRPDDAGNSLALIAALADRVPILGVCLGHQCIVQHFGGEIVSAAALMHGKTSLVRHDGSILFSGLPNPFAAGRYHSLAADRARLPAGLDVTARTDDGEIMAVRHRELPIEGVQFHPESVLTPDGPRLMRNFLYPERASARDSRTER